jgi:hypothetical protein
LESEGKTTIDGIGIQMKLPREYANIFLCVNQDIVEMLSWWKLEMG